MLTLALSLGFATTGLTGCETDSDRQISAGQACLDSASTPTQADQCIAIVQGLTSPEASLIRCSANFVAQGFTASRIASSISKVKSGTGTSQLAGMMSYLVFGSTTSGNHTADMAVINCQASGVRSMLRLALAAQMATTIAGIGGIPVNAADPAAAMATAISSFAGSSTPAQQTALGNTAVLAQSSYCASGSSYASTDVCTKLSAAVNVGGGAQAIGARLATLLNTP